MPLKHPLLVLMCALPASCATVEAPVDHRPTGSAYSPAPVSNYDPEPASKGFHEVDRGDTLYSIAFRYSLDYRDVARWNDVSSPYVIYPGQRLRLIPAESPRAGAGAPARPADRPAGKPQPLIITNVPDPAAAPPRPAARDNTPPPAPRASVPGPLTNRADISWRWPTAGRIVSSGGPIAQKGLNISGREGQPVEAAADGVVVYSGSGLLGYGKLIIIKHNDTYLSAYAHNQIMQVKEGDRVSAGQRIGTMGRGSRGEPELHFEIRKDGKPVDPLAFLPDRS